MYATPNGAVATVISVPGEAARVASSPMSRETLSEMFGFTTRILIATPHQVVSGGSSLSGKRTRADRERASVRLSERLIPASVSVDGPVPSVRPRAAGHQSGLPTAGIRPRNRRGPGGRDHEPTGRRRHPTVAPVSPRPRPRRACPAARQGYFRGVSASYGSGVAPGAGWLCLLVASSFASASPASAWPPAGPAFASSAGRT